MGGPDKKTLFGIVFYGGWGTPSARNRIIAIPTIAQVIPGERNSAEARARRNPKRDSKVSGQSLKIRDCHPIPHFAVIQAVTRLN